MGTGPVARRIGHVGALMTLYFIHIAKNLKMNVATKCCSRLGNSD
jgi:hypothetical protein